MLLLSLLLKRQHSLQQVLLPADEPSQLLLHLVVLFVTLSIVHDLLSISPLVLLPLFAHSPRVKHFHNASSVPIKMVESAAKNERTLK